MSKPQDNKWGNICERVDTCALTGAAAFVGGIPGAEILCNGPLWCYFYALRHLEHAEYDMAERFHGSQPDNNAVVYGSEKYLLETLQRLFKREQVPELLFIEASCSMSLIGDDLNGIATKAALPCPFVTMDCGGMVGGFAEGYAKAGMKVLEKFAKDNVTCEAGSVNVLGMTPFYLNGSADSKEMRSLLSKAGYIIQSMPGAGSSLEELALVGRAQLNIVTNEELGLPLAQYLQERFGTPYILAGLPYGVEGTVDWLQKLAKVLPAVNMHKLEAEAEATHGFLTSWINDARCVWGSLWFDKVAVCAPPTMALCLAQSLRSEWLDTAQLEVLCQRQLPNKNAQHYCTTADAIYCAGVDNPGLNNLLSGEQLLLLGSSSEASYLYRQGRKHFVNLNVAFPANDEYFFSERPWIGFTGARVMLERIWNAYIWQKMRE
ncbi:MAG: nitrogenase component 1 [Phascolarctobacterium sp.]|nr:nitrogenase component 1 [Phascolarctobacterium sp.]